MQDNKVGEQKLYKQFGHFNLLIAICVLYTHLGAESFSEFKRSQVSSFKQYKDKNDEKFSKFLKSDWAEYNAKESQILYESPKPSKLLVAQKREIKKIGPKVHIIIQGAQKDTTNKTAKENVLELSTVEKPVSINKDISFDFFGSKIALDIPNNINNAKFYPQNQKGIANFFNTVVSLEYEYFIDDIKKIIIDFNLNDWGRYLLIKNISENIFSSQDDSRLISWFIFNKLGYSLRVGLANRHILVMHQSKKIIYNTPIYSIKKKNFYVLSDYAKSRISRVYTYEQDYPESTKVLDLSLETLPKLMENTQEKKITFKHGAKNYQVTYSYNQNLIDFMSTYPQADYETFFNTPLEIQSYNDIANELRKHINAKTSSEAINFVLNFVQNAFEYQVDAKQFGREKVMFAQETLYYAKSDCEDRAILFAYLAKKLFKVGVVGVKYKDHMATALYIPMKGDSVRVNKRRFIIADPTYINARIGQSMKKYKSKKPKDFIFLNSIKG